MSANPVLKLPRRFLALSAEQRLMPVLAGAAFLSGALIAAALFFQYVMGLPPCKLCIVQRYPHFAVLALGVTGLALGTVLTSARARAELTALLLCAAGIAFAVTGGYGIYHGGAEQGWWPGPADCTGAAVPGSIDALGALLAEGEQFVRCDEIPWSFLGVSMAGWNALISLAAAVFVLWVAGGYLKARLSAPGQAQSHG